MAYCDLHNHLLPDLDDGSTSPEETLRHLRAFAAVGVETLVFTPHLLLPVIEEDELDAELERQRERFEEIVEAFGDDPSVPRLLLGQEILTPHAGHIERVVGRSDAGHIERVVGRSDVGLGGGEALLVEFGFTAGFDAESVIERILAEGRTPVVAHPERYAFGDFDPVETVTRWRDRGALLQVNGGSLAGLHRGRSREIACRMLAEGLIDVVASDHHGDYRNHEPSMLLETIETVGEPGLARRLWGRGPRAAIADVLEPRRAAAA